MLKISPVIMKSQTAFGNQSRNVEKNSENTPQLLPTGSNQISHRHVNPLRSGVAALALAASVLPLTACRKQIPYHEQIDTILDAPSLRQGNTFEILGTKCEITEFINKENSNSYYIEARLNDKDTLKACFSFNPTGPDSAILTINNPYTDKSKSYNVEIKNIGKHNSFECIIKNNSNPEENPGKFVVEYKDGDVIVKDANGVKIDEIKCPTEFDDEATFCLIALLVLTSGIWGTTLLSLVAALAGLTGHYGGGDGYSGCSDCGSPEN